MVQVSLQTKVEALANLREMIELGITSRDIRRWLTPRQIHGYYTGRFLSGHGGVPNMHNVALSIMQSIKFKRPITYQQPREAFWWNY